jgi:predicted kinase
MSDPRSTARSVKIGADERTGWSSDRPRREGSTPRPADVSTRCRVLRPTDRMRYSPGSLVVVVSPSAQIRDAFIERVFEEKGVVFTLGKIRSLVQGRVPAEELEQRAADLQQAAVTKRLQAGESVVIGAEGLDPQERDRWVRLAHANRRPRHIILVEAARDQVSDEDTAALNDLRTALDAGDLGAEGFQTAMRLGGAAIDELKRVVFRPAPRDD